MTGLYLYSRAIILFGPWVVRVAVLGADNPIPARHRAPLEMHMVHRNDKYKTMAEALNKTDGILILATLFEVRQSWAESLEHLRLFYVPFRVLH